jgi:hypothetical protein
MRMSRQMKKPIGVLDPQRIAETVWDGPKKWDHKHPKLAKGKNFAEKEKIWRSELEQSMMRVAAYIGVAFKHFEDCDRVICPYNFR